jgi:hypothetical protein
VSGQTSFKNGSRGKSPCSCSHKRDGCLTLLAGQDELAQALSGLSLGGPFITQKGFWEDEGGGDNPAMSAPLLDRNNGSLSSTADGNADILKRTAGWAALCGADKVDKVRRPLTHAWGYLGTCRIPTLTVSYKPAAASSNSIEGCRNNAEHHLA